MFCSFSYSQNNTLDSAYIYFKSAIKFDKKNEHFKAYKNYIKAKELYFFKKHEDSIAICNLHLFQLITSQNNLENNSKQYLDAYYNYALKKDDTLKLLTSYLRYAQYYFKSDKKLSSSFYHKVIKSTKKKNYIANSYANLALLYTKSEPDSASHYFTKTLELYTEDDKEELFSTYLNYGNFYQKQNNFKEAITQLKKAEKIKLSSFKLKYNKILYGKFSNCYQAIGDYKNAYEYYGKYNDAKDSLNNTAQNIAIKDLDKKYKTAEKEKENLQLKIDTQKTRDLLFGSLLFILFGGIIGYLFIKSSKRKQKVAEQQKELEQQKNITLLKEQEITTINAMVDGQEKERKRIAEDLHDNLGSVLATLKLHFDNLKINREKKKINQETLFDKTENLIDEAYLKVRSIAHAKNAGVIANQGLLIAVKMMAEKISSADKLQIEVIDFGLDKRLENNIEITVFRIIQELITNIIKHGNAKNATINISFYDKNLNVIVEDDGKGFDIDKVNLKDGMGINSIKTRITHLNGNFEIDSTINKGTTIIINLPIT